MIGSRVLVAFANQAGSTAGLADTIAGVLRRSGLEVDCRVASEVVDLAPYRAVILGSGVFVPRRRSDGGGFLVRHAAQLNERALWLFSAGPIGRGRCAPGSPALATEECGVVAVGRAVGARGTAVFGPVGLSADEDPVAQLGPVSVQRVRAWAAEVALQLLRLPDASRETPQPSDRRGRVQDSSGVPATASGS